MLVEKTARREFFFWEKVNKLPGEDSCWLWTGAKNSKGYGWLTVHIDKKQRFFFAHKISFEWENGDIPAGSIVRHRCDTPLCIRPSHLLLGSHQDNTDDKMKRGRYVSGVAEIDAPTAVEIRVRKAAGETTQSLAVAYGFSDQHINSICRGVYWPDAGGPLTFSFRISDSIIYSVLSDIRRMTHAAAGVKNGISKAAVQKIAAGKTLPKTAPSDEYQLSLLQDLDNRFWCG